MLHDGQHPSNVLLPFVLALVIAYVLALSVMTMISVVAGWLLAGRALRPLRDITATARRVSPIAARATKAAALSGIQTAARAITPSARSIGHPKGRGQIRLVF